MYGKKQFYPEQAAASTQNIYQLDGKVPLLKAIPFGLQHILAMFVANLTPITLIGAASGLDHAQIAVLLQNAMFVAGIATLIQLSHLEDWFPPAGRYGCQLYLCDHPQLCRYNLRLPDGDGSGADWRLDRGNTGSAGKVLEKIITPVVAASVVTAIGYSPFHRWNPFLRRRIYGEFWFPSKPAARYDYAGGMPAVQYLCKRLLEAAFGAGRSYHRLSGCTCHGYGRPQRHLFGRLSFAASSSAVFS